MQCVSDQECPFQFRCLDTLCRHYPVFPISIYPMAVYLLLPVVATICNLGGLSIGAFKIILFMDMLNYGVSEATNYVYVVITGASLANLISLLNKRHPTLETSLVDYHIVLLLIPGLLLGTNFGVLLRTMLMDIIQDGLGLVVLLFFGIVYMKKFSRLRKKINEVTQTDQQRHLPLNLNRIQPIKSIYQLSAQGDQFLRYKKTNHTKDIIICFSLFLLLQSVSVFSSGKILLFFKTCSPLYWASQAVFVLVVICSIFAVLKWIRLEMREYKAFGYSYDLDLAKSSVNLTLIGGSVLAGLCQGTMGIGSGYVIIFCMLQLGVLPQVTAAVSGFIIFFIGVVSLVQVIVLGQLQWQEALLLFGITFVGSSVGTYWARRVLKGKKFVDLMVMAILTVICFVSILGIIVNVVMTSHYFGFSSLTKLKPFCQ